jgi:hypothetical protein
LDKDPYLPFRPQHQAKATPSTVVPATLLTSQQPDQSQKKGGTCSTAAKLCQLFSPKPTKKDKNYSPRSDDTLIVPIPEKTTLKTGVPDGRKEGFTIVAPRNKKKKKGKKGNRGDQTTVMSPDTIAGLHDGATFTFEEYKSYAMAAAAQSDQDSSPSTISHASSPTSAKQSFGGGQDQPDGLNRNNSPNSDKSNGDQPSSSSNILGSTPSTPADPDKSYIPGSDISKLGAQDSANNGSNLFKGDSAENGKDSTDFHQGDSE